MNPSNARGPREFDCMQRGDEADWTEDADPAIRRATHLNHRYIENGTNSPQDPGFLHAAVADRGTAGRHIRLAMHRTAFTVEPLLGNPEVADEVRGRGFHRRLLDHGHNLLDSEAFYFHGILPPLPRGKYAGNSLSNR